MVRVEGICNCSCTSIDRAEHSLDRTPSRAAAEDRATRSLSVLEGGPAAAPPPKELEHLCCQLAAEVPSRTLKGDGGTHVARCFEQREAVAKLAESRPRGAEATFYAMADRGLARRVAHGATKGQDLYRFSDEVLPAHMRVVLQTFRLPTAPGCTTEATARVRYAGDAAAAREPGAWHEVKFRRPRCDDDAMTEARVSEQTFAPASGGDERGIVSLELPTPVVRGEDASKALELEVRWTEKGVPRAARTTLTLEIFKNQVKNIDFVGGYERELEQARVMAAQGRLRIWYETTVEGIQFSKKFSHVVPPERPMDDYKEAPAAAAPPDALAATTRSRSSSEPRGPPAFLRCFALATPGVEHLRASRAGAAAVASDRRWDQTTHDWSVFCRLEDVRGSKLKTEGVLAVFGGNYVVTVGARLRDPSTKDWLGAAKASGHEVKSAPAPKDWLELGAEWGAGASEENAKDRSGGLVVVHGAARRSTGVLRLNVYERVRTDLFETYQLGHIDVPLLDVPVVRNPNAPPRQPASAGLRTYEIRRRSILTGRHSKNGQLRAAIWMQARTRESTVLNRYLSRWPYVAALATVAVAWAARARWGRTRLEAFFIFVWLARTFLSLEWPRLTGAALGAGIRAAAPGLDLRVEGCSIRADLWPSREGSDFRLAVDCQGVRIVNPGRDYVRDDFVSADSVRVVLRCDRQILHRGVAMLGEVVRAKGAALCQKIFQRLDADGDGDVDVKDVMLNLGLAKAEDGDKPPPSAVACAWRVAFEAPKARGRAGKPPMPGDDVYLKLVTTTEEPLAVARTAVVALDVARAAVFPPVTVPLAQLRRRESDGGVVDVFAYRRQRDRADDYLGVAQRCVLADVANPIDAHHEVIQLTLKRQGVAVGVATGGATIVSERIDDDGTAVENQGDALVRWNPFPARHHRLVERAPGAPPTRLTTVVVEDLRVRGATVAFGMARGEFNVNRFVRAIDEGKVAAALPKRHRARPPNTLSVYVMEGKSMPPSCYVSLSLRRQHRTTATRSAAGPDRAVVFEPHHAFEFPCPDPSAVFVASVVDARNGRIIGRWLVTAKMLVLNALNVYGGEPEGPVDKGADGAPVMTWTKDDVDGRATYALEGRMLLRGPKGQLMEGMSEKELTLRVVYHYKRGAPTQRDLLDEKPMTALEQLQLNSLETNLRLGDVKLVKRMLDDFPLLLDVRSCQIAEASCYLSELFAGYEGKGESAKFKLNASKIVEKLKPADDDDEGKGKHADHIYLPVLDLKDACKFEGGLSLGAICAMLLSPTVVSPILNRLDLSHAIAHFAGGGLFSFQGKKKGASKRKVDDDEEIVDEEDDQLARLSRNDTERDLEARRGSLETDADRTARALTSREESSLTSRERAFQAAEAANKGTAARERAFLGRRTSSKVSETVVALGDQLLLRQAPAYAGPLLRSTGPKTREYPFHVAVYGGSLFWTRLKPDLISRTGQTSVVVLAGADVAGDADGVRVAFAPDAPKPGAKPRPGAVVYLRIPEDVPKRAAVVKDWAASLAAAAAKEIAEEDHVVTVVTPTVVRKVPLVVGTVSKAE